jgi:hypothetical protein
MPEMLGHEVAVRIGAIRAPPDPKERHETPDPRRSNALNSRFHSVRHKANGARIDDTRYWRCQRDRNSQVAMSG